jgi:hypothetical protein
LAIPKISAGKSMVLTCLPLISFTGNCIVIPSALCARATSYEP